MEESPRNWMGLPRELLENILRRLDIVDIQLSARKVCTSWRRICKDPAMWKFINMWNPRAAIPDPVTLIVFQRRAKTVFGLISSDQLIELSIGWLGDDHILHYTVRPSNKIRDYCLTQAPKSAPKLEKLHILCTDMIAAEDIEVIGRNCPKLKSFKLEGFDTFYEGDKYALAIANSMPELRHLHLSGTRMKNNGLQAILDGCPHLQSLHICMSSEHNLCGNLGKLCKEGIEDFKCRVTKSYHFNRDSGALVGYIICLLTMWLSYWLFANNVVVLLVVVMLPKFWV